MRIVKEHWRLMVTGLLLAVGVGCMGLVAGCAGGPPGYLYTPYTNLLSEAVAPRTNTVSVTNFVFRTVNVTNLVSAPGEAPRYEITVMPVREGTISNYTTVTLQTNRDYAVSYQVSTNAAGLANTAGSLTNLFAPGLGGLVAKGILGLLSLGAGAGGLFARKYRQEGDAIAVVAQTHKELGEKTATALSQVIQTYREVAQSTPQGAIVDAQLKSWMQQHQQATGVIDLVSEAVNNEVDDAAAKELARQVMAEAQRLSGKAAA